jgi:taurine--2-oxoglutarate transaminase
LEDDPIEIIKKYLYGTWAQQKKWDPRPLIVGAEGPYLIDRDGNRYLDFSSQLVCVNLGYGNNEVIDAIKDQLEKIPYAGPGVALEVRAAAAKELASVVPANLKNSSSRAAALRPTKTPSR